MSPIPLPCSDLESFESSVIVRVIYNKEVYIFPPYYPICYDYSVTQILILFPGIYSIYLISHYLLHLSNLTLFTQSIYSHTISTTGCHVFFQTTIIATTQMIVDCEDYGL